MQIRRELLRKLKSRIKLLMMQTKMPREMKMGMKSKS